MNAVLKKETLTENFLAVEKTLWEVVWNFWYRYEGDVEELKARANYFFIEADEAYDKKKTKGKYSSWIYYYVWWNLHNSLFRRKAKPLFEGLPEDCRTLYKKSKRSFYELMEDLGADAKTMVRIVLDDPEGLTKLDLQNGFSACQTRVHIKNYCKKLGWTHRRIKETFKEIRRIIND